MTKKIKQSVKIGQSFLTKVAIFQQKSEEIIIIIRPIWGRMQFSTPEKNTQKKCEPKPAFIIFIESILLVSLLNLQERNSCSCQRCNK